jgi:hypothetical protein
MDNVIDLPIEISFDEAKQILSKLRKFVSEDWAFGDAEAYWADEDGNEVAGSYRAGRRVSLWFTDNRVVKCTDDQLIELNNCYAAITRGRNDSLDKYGE